MENAYLPKNLKAVLLSFTFVFMSVHMFGQRIVFPGQNHLYRFLEDPSFISLQKEYNMTGLVQASDSEMAQTSQYLTAQLSFFDNIAFGLDYSRHSFDSYRYGHVLFSGRARIGLGDYYHYINLGVSVGPDKTHQTGTAEGNSRSTTYRVGAHYTHYNFTVGGVMNRYPLQDEALVNNHVQPPLTSDGYSIYASYDFALLTDLRLTPQIRYNAYHDLHIFEGIVVFNYNGDYELAFSYKNDYSINPQLGAKILKRVKISYSYEKSLGPQIFKDVHALGLSVNLGSKKTDDPEWLANVKKNNAQIKRLKKNKKEIKIKDPASENKNDALLEEAVIAVNEDVTETPKPMSENDPEDTIENRLNPGHYIVLGSFKILDNATKEIERLKRKGYYARMGKKDDTDKFNYVYVDRYTDKNIALKRLKEIKKEKGLEKTWILSID